MNTERIAIVDKYTISRTISLRMGLTIADSMRIIDIFSEEIVESIKQNKKVQLNGFLVFDPRDVEGRTIISPLDNKKYEVPPKRVVDVRVGKLFKDAIKDSYIRIKEEVKDVDSKESRKRKKTSKQVQ